MAFDYDLLVIGGGPAGLAAAKRAAAYGANVAIAEQGAIGGTCVNRGCVPKKLMVYAADLPQRLQDAVGYGWQPVETHLNWSHLMQAIAEEVQRLNEVHAEALDKAGVEVLDGRGVLVAPHTVSVGDRQVTANKILLAVGGKPLQPTIPGVEQALTSREMFQLQQLPRSIAIVGGGYIGVEFASLLCRLGVDVTVVDTQPEILSGFDLEIRQHVQAALAQAGIKFLGETTTQAIAAIDEGFRLELSGKGPEMLVAEQVLIAVGRSPNTQQLGLETVGVETDQKGAIAVDEFSRTSQPYIFAVGDCTNRLALTPVAKMEGIAFADTEFGQRSHPVNYEVIPTAVFARPEAASVGLTEAQAQEKLGEAAVRCDRAEFTPLFFSLAEHKQKSFIKLVCDRRSDRVLGAHMVGEAAAEIIQSLAIAIRLGATKQDFDANIGIHPSSAEEFFTL